MKRVGFGWWLAWTTVCLLGGAGFSTAGWLSFAAVKALADGFSADGNFNILTPLAFNELVLPLRAAGALLLLAAAFLLTFRAPARRILSQITPALRVLPAELGKLASIFRPKPGEWPYLVGVLGIIVAGVLARALFATAPMGHDEAYTYIAFAARPWWDALSDYHLPNNHIFHTVLVKLATSALGMAPWIVRLPALVTGVLCIPAAYWLGKRLYSRQTGLLSAGLVAALPMWIDYNTNARGYSQVALFSLLLFGLAIYLSEHKNRAGWVLFSLIGALGFFTLPPMLYPFGMALTWLAVTALIEGGSAYGGRGKLLAYALIFAGLTVFLAALCYLPVVMGSGLKSLIANPFVRRFTLSDFIQTFPLRMADTWNEWSWDVPQMGLVFLVAGMLVSIAAHARISRVRISTQLTTIAWLAVILLLQRPDPIARLWTFLIPFWLIWSAAGLVEGLRMLRVSSRWRTGMVALALIGLAVFSWQHTVRYFPALAPGQGDVETIVLYLQPRLAADDGVIITSDDGPALWYYLRLHGVDDRTTVQKLDERVLERVYILVSESQGQTLQSAAADRRLKDAVFDFSNAQRLTRIGGTAIYLCEVEYNR